MSVYSSGTPGMATIPAIRRSSWYSASVTGEMISLTFFNSFTLRSAVFARSQPIASLPETSRSC